MDLCNFKKYLVQGPRPWAWISSNESWQFSTEYLSAYVFMYHNFFTFDIVTKRFSSMLL